MNRLITGGSIAAIFGCAAAAPTRAGNLVTNGGFESADFSGWTVGNRNDIRLFVDDGSNTDISPRGGVFEAAFASSGRVNTLTQNVATTPGQAYTLEFYFAADGGLPSNFFASFNGVDLFQVQDPEAQDFTRYTYQVAATAAASRLQFGG